MRHAFCTTLVIIALSYPVLAQEQPSAAVPVGVREGGTDRTRR